MHFELNERIIVYGMQLGHRPFVINLPLTKAYHDQQLSQSSLPKHFQK